MNFLVQIKGRHISCFVESLYPKQVFIDPIGADVYEGVGKAEMRFALTQKKEIVISSGTAWIEQNLGGS